MAKKSKDYFGLPWIVSVILALIPFTAWLFGMVTRFSEKKYVAGIIRIFGGWVLWVIDFLCVLFTGKIFRILNC